MKRIKKYYRIQFQLTSPLAVGSGENHLTDRDIVRDSRGIPYIPGTALAGVYRSLFPKEIAEQYFGPELTEERITQSSKAGKNLLTDSDVVTYDACLEDPEGCVEKLVTKRDMVALDAYKTAIPGAKSDFQVLEPGLTFVTYIEQNMDDLKQSRIVDQIARAWMDGRIMIGAKTGRGYGHTRGIRAEAAIFDLGKKDPKDGATTVSGEKQADQVKTLGSWLAFDMYCPEDVNWSPAEDIKTGTMCVGEQAGMCSISLELRQQGGIAIRRYTTEVGAADYIQLTTQRIAGEEGEDEKEGTPVIPGTSWAGAFRAQMGRLDPDFCKGQPIAEKFFGKEKNQDGDSRKSGISFSESRITGGKWVLYTRNAIDRFTGAAVTGALYTEKTYYNGETTLEIACDFGRNGEAASGIHSDEREKFAQVMAAAILDLNSGYLAVGGLTAVGRGLFAVKKAVVDGKEIVFAGRPDGDIYQELVKAIAGKGE